MKKNLTHASVLKAFVLIALGALLTSCGQNPHVLGQDPSLAGGIRGPAPDGTDESGGGKGEEKKECVRPTVSFFPSREVKEADKKLAAGSRTFFATDIQLPPRSVITDLSLVKLSIDAPTSPGRTTSSGDEICLQEEGFCADVGEQDLSGINLFGVFKSVDWNEVLYAHSTLTWSVPTEWGMNDALLSVAYMQDYCAEKKPKEEPKQ